MLQEREKREKGKEGKERGGDETSRKAARSFILTGSGRSGLKCALGHGRRCPCRQTQQSPRLSGYFAMSEFLGEHSMDVVVNCVRAWTEFIRPIHLDTLHTLFCS